MWGKKTKQNQKAKQTKPNNNQNPPNFWLGEKIANKYTKTQSPLSLTERERKL